MAAERKPAVRVKDAGDSERKAYCFVSYSTREQHVQLLLECIKMLFSPYYGVELTPSALASGASQRDQITKAISGCTFGVVCLDGLRPNVSFEYGILHGQRKPVILLREANAQVDMGGFYRDSPDLALGPVSLDLDSHFSDVKDVNYATWSRYSISDTMKVLWNEFQKKKSEIEPFTEIPKPKW